MPPLSAIRTILLNGFRTGTGLITPRLGTIPEPADGVIVRCCLGQLANPASGANPVGSLGTAAGFLSANSTKVIVFSRFSQTILFVR